MNVSRLCFGSLTMGPLQANLSLEEGADLLCYAFQNGINFIDTAEIYGNYEHIARALSRYKGEVAIATKTYAYTREQAQKSLKSALKTLNRNYIDIFLLHEQESYLTLQGHRPALEYLVEEKKRGNIRAVGISCHTVAAVKAAFSFKEISVIHPILNIRGLGIKDGSLKDMINVLREAKEHGIGIYSMKPLGGGHLQNSSLESLSFVRDLSFVDSVAVGLRSFAEIDFALHLFRGEKVPSAVYEQISRKKRMLSYIPEDCTECFSCIEACPQKALNWESNRPVVVEDKCIWCGYCGANCPGFCLRIV